MAVHELQLCLIRLNFKSKCVIFSLYSLLYYIIIKAYYIRGTRLYYIDGLDCEFYYIWDFVWPLVFNLTFFVTDPTFPGNQVPMEFNKILAFNLWTIKRVSLCSHSHVPRRSSRKPICSLRESMRSSCWKEWDSKVVFSDMPSSNDSGKKLLKGVSTNCSFLTERWEEVRKKRKMFHMRTITHRYFIYSSICSL